MEYTVDKGSWTWLPAKNESSTTTTNYRRTLCCLYAAHREMMAGVKQLKRLINTAGTSSIRSPGSRPSGHLVGLSSSRLSTNMPERLPPQIWTPNSTWIRFSLTSRGSAALRMLEPGSLKKKKILQISVDCISHPSWDTHIKIKMY